MKDRRWLKRVDAALTWAGGAFARLRLLLLGIAVLFSFPVARIALLLVIGWGTLRCIVGGAWTFFPAAYVFGLFLSIYVWSPSVKPT
jgi:hypothetical protein